MHDNVVSLVTVDSSDTHNRPLANFDPTIWGDYFLTHVSSVTANDSTQKQEHDELKKKVRRMLRDADDDLQNLELINAVQRLGVSYHFETEIEEALQRLHREAINLDQSEASHNETLLRFSKLDFNMIQAQHQEELGHMTKWWKDLAVPTKLPYARDRIVETFFWIIGVYFEPRYRKARIVLTKTMWITSLMDDTYDAYGTFEENELFAKAMDRLDISCMNELPEYMQLLYGEIIKLCDEIEENTRKEGRPFCVDYAKEEFKNLSKAYFTEAKWCREKHIPTMEEYDSVGVVTSTFPLLITNALVGLGEIATEDVFHWMSSTPKILRASSYICRVMNDIVSHKFERARGQLLPSSVECYMKQYGVDEEDAISYLRKKLRDAWKEINEEFLESSKDVPMHVLECVLNVAQASDVVYKDDDGYTKPSVTKHEVSLLLAEPIIV